MMKASLSFFKSGIGIAPLFLFLFFFSGKQLSAVNVTTIDASELTPETIKKHADLKITGTLTPDVVEAFKRAGTGPYTGSPNFNVNSVDFSQSILTDSLAMDSIFMNYIKLQSVSLPEQGAEYIKSMNLAFFTTSLTEINLSQCHGLISIRQAFDGCKQLVKVDMSGCEKIEDLFLAFSNAPMLEEITMPTHAPELKNMFHMLMTNKSMLNITLPAIVHPDCNSSYSFVDCRSLEKVTLPSNLTQMKEAMLFSCPKLSRIIYEGDQLLLWNEEAFTSNRAESSTHPQEITLYVKKEWVDLYRADPGWQTLKAIESLAPTGISLNYQTGTLRLVSYGGQTCIESSEPGEAYIYTTNGNPETKFRIEKGITPIPYLSGGCHLIYGSNGKETISLKIINSM